MSDSINQLMTRLFVGQPRLHRVCQSSTEVIVEQPLALPGSAKNPILDTRISACPSSLSSVCQAQATPLRRDGLEGSDQRLISFNSTTKRKVLHI